ncbi:hypothetical protein AAVH_35919, partial [Aphelenchoides avenae]
YILFAGGFLEKGYMFLVPNGLIAGLSPMLDHVAMTVFCISLHTNIVLVVCQFVWRNSLICQDKSFIRVRKITALLPVIWCIPQVITATWCWIIDHDEELNRIGIEILSENGWHFENGTRPPYPSLTPGAGLKTRLHHAFYLISSLLGYGIIINCQIGVLKFLRELGVPSNHKTQRAHTEVNRALIALAMTPMVSVAPVTTVIVSNMLEIPLGGAVSAYLSIAVPIITLANPLVTIGFIRPYREGLLHLLRIRDKNKIEPAVTNMNGLSALSAISESMG